MSIGTNIPVEDIESLVSRIRAESSALNDRLNALRSACAREASFTGSAATQYDEFLTRWDASQSALIQNLHDASSLLDSLAQETRRNSELVAASFGR